MLIAHLLKWQHQSELRQDSTWKATIVEQRVQIALVLEDSPSLKRHIGDAWAKVYRAAVALAHSEMPAEIPLPKTCPYTQRQVLDSTFYPDKLRAALIALR